jgi:hypothetical protein
METKINEIFNAINQNVLFIDSPNKLEPFHIYFKLKNFYKDILTPEDNLNMYIHHLKLEKCLSQLRQRNFDGANGLLIEIEKLDRVFPEFVQNGMDALYYAMLSYNDYVANNNIEEALTKLKLAIKSGIKQSTYYGYFSVSIPTQWVNILRVLIRVKREKEIIKESALLLKYTLYGIHDDVLLCKAYNEVGTLEHNSFLQESLDNLILNLEKSFGYSGMRSILNNVISIVLSEHYCNPSYNESIVRILRIIQKYDIGHIEGFIEELHTNIQRLNDVPDLLKKIVIDSFKSIRQEEKLFEVSESPLYEVIMA